ncbi:hypothetical protein [Tenacibaculum jejuense]|uniref:Uncharacterized protein n=1 Tax=Tenacibaculum jejuense TaxID=584609 RepID=A0A238UDU3_9FLAO|nr:hypothetical protein [Tenacibaculum jejuense]SNR16758.1 membrane protein of unknown function [Tenacibaculum jejuense]
MNKTIVITTWLNRVFMLLIFGSLLIGLFFSLFEYAVWSLVLAIPLGIFQVIAGINLYYVIKEEDQKSYKRINYYTNSVGIYFLVCFILYFTAESIPFNIDFLGYILTAIPIILALFFTYLIECLYKLEKQEI